jgi:hypothetical protein
MAQKQPYLSVDEDIEPLRARYFEYANTNVRPENRERAYKLINETFGSVQAVRDAQRAREEDRLDFENKRMIVETNRMQLEDARRRQAQQQEDAKVYGQVRTELDNIRNDTTLTPDEKHQRVLDFGAQYGDIIGGNSALKYQFGRAAAATKPKTPPRNREAEAAVSALQSHLKGAEKEGTDVDSGFVDAGLQALDQLGLIDPADKEKLYKEAGISALATPTEAENWGSKADWKSSTSTRSKILNTIVGKAVFKTNKTQRLTTDTAVESGPDTKGRVAGLTEE